jgi:hypothetical protein
MTDAQFSDFKIMFRTAHGFSAGHEWYTLIHLYQNRAPFAVLDDLTSPDKE